MLDLFAGAGSLGLEAWSRGATSVVFVEQNPLVWKNLQGSIHTLDQDELGAVRCVKADAFRWMGRAGEAFDLIFADPPYNLPDAMTQTLAGIMEHSVLTDGGLLVYELRSSDVFEISKDWNVLRNKVYGDTRVLMLKLNDEDVL